MRLTIENTPEQVQLVKAMASRDRNVATASMDAFAAAVEPVLALILQQAATSGLVFRDLPYDEDDRPEIPLDLFYDQSESNFVQTWSQNVAGGMPSNAISGSGTFKFSTYELQSAVNFLKRYIQRSDLNVLAKGLERMTGSMILKQDRNAWACLLTALAQGSTNSLTHVFTANTQNVFQIQDISTMILRSQRINTSWAGGTPAAVQTQGITDIFVSPEIKDQIRGFAYNPMNTRAGGGSTTGLVALPDSVRENIFKAAGTAEIFGVNVSVLNEFGSSQAYNALFAAVASASISFSSANFSNSGDEILVGVDLQRDACLRPVAKNAANGSTLTVQPDDQFSPSRSGKIGFWMGLEEGRAVLDARALIGCIV